MPEGMFPRLRLERKTAPKNLVAANGEHIRDLGEQTIPVRTKMHNIQKCERCQAYHFCRMLSDRETLWCWIKKRFHTFATLKMER